MELTITFIGCLLVVSSGSMIFVVARYLNLMRLTGSDLPPAGPADRYRPMLRLLANDDFRYLAAGGWGNGKLLRARAERRQLFRRYLRSLAKDYSRLLAGLRLQMIHSEVDRPDLARAIAKNRVLFTLGIVKIEFCLMLHAVGLSEVNVSGMVDLIESLRTQASTSFNMPVPATVASSAR